MAMLEKVIEFIEGMQAEGIIDKYAIGGGFASIYYVEPFYTYDIDIFIVPMYKRGLINLSPIFNYAERIRI